MMKTFTYTLLLLLALLSSCRREEEERVLAAALPAIEFSGAAGNVDLTITSNGRWTISVSDSWLLPGVSKGSGDAVVKCIVALNRSTSERSATITVTGERSVEQLVVKQRGATFTIAPASITFPEAASPQTVTVTSTGEWKIRNADDAPWCRFSQAGGSGDAVITLTPDPLVDRWQSRGPVEIVFESGGVTRRLSLKHDFALPPYHEEGAVIVYRQGTVANPVKMVVLGDGFIRADYEVGGAFDQVANKMIDGFFNEEPYKSYREYFTVYKVIAYSNERGATIEKDITTGQKQPRQERDTRFKSVLAGGGSTSIDGDHDEVFTWARKVPGIDLDKSGVFLLVNLDAWAGVTHSWTSGRFIARGGIDYNVVGRMLHEGGGHGFGRLKDEYINHEDTITREEKDNIITRRAGDWWRYAGNVDLSGSRERAHWNYYYTIPGYEHVGWYEGCCLYRHGAWRPEYLSIMEKSSYPYFNAPSREAIVRRVFERAGESFDFTTFLSKDINTPPSPTSRALLPREVLTEPVELD
jgi:hypothetical protein